MQTLTIIIYLFFLLVILHNRSIRLPVLRRVGVLALLLVGFLAGCTPSADPYTLRAAGEDAIRQAEFAMTATAESAIRANEAVILQQAQTQTSNDNQATATAQTYQSAATATAIYQDAQATERAAIVQATGTQEAAIIRSTEQAVYLSQLQAGATATQQAVINLAEAEKAELARQKVITVAGWFGLAVAIGLALMLGWQFAQWGMRTASGRRSFVPEAEAFVLDMGKGITVVTPRKMFSPALQLDSAGRASMPMLTLPDLQAYTTAAAMAVEVERERAKKPQWFTPVGKGGIGESFTPMLNAEDVPTLSLPELKPLPYLTDRHLMVVGGTGSGKTYIARYLLHARQTAYILDPHDDGHTWPDHCRVIGGGRNFDQIAETISEMATLLDNRFKQREMSGGGHFDDVTLAVDELPAIVSRHPDVAKTLMQIGMEGRKVNVFLLLLTQSVLVRSLGIEGQGDLRENFATVKIDPLPSGVSQDTPRTVTVIVGNLAKPESQERYIVPASVPIVPADVLTVPAHDERDPGTHVLGKGTNSPAPGTAEETALIRSLYAQGFVPDRIAMLLGGRKERTLERIKITLGALGA